MKQFALSQHASVVWVKLILLLPTAIFATLTFITHAFRILDWSFQTYKVLSAIITILILAFWILLVRAERSKIRVRDHAVLAGILALGLGGAFLASIYNLPDSDDYSYVPNAVHYLTDPSDAMGNEVHFVYADSEPILSVIANTSQPFEYAQALIAGLLGLEYLTVYYVLAVAAVGSAIPLAVYMLLSCFADDTRNAALAALVTIAVLTILGETRYSFGSLSFTRLFQGKVVLLAAGLPLFSAYSLYHLDDPSRQNWSYVVLVATALSGLSSSALFLIPMLTLAIGLAFLLSIRSDLQGVRRIVIYGAALVYPVVYGLYASQAVTRSRDVGNPLLAGWPWDFLGHLRLLLDEQRPVSFLLILACLVIVAILIRGYRRKLLFAWVAIEIALFLNPISGRFWIDNVIGPSIYWRVFLLLPISVIVGLAAISVLERLSNQSWLMRATATGGVVAALIGLHFVPSTTSIFRRGGQIGIPSYKLSSRALEASRWIVKNIEPGVMLAPPDVAGVTGMLSGGYPQLHYGNRPLLEWIDWNDAQTREWASYFAGGDSAKEQYFRMVVEQVDDLQIVVIDNQSVADVNSFLASKGFVEMKRLENHTVYWR